MQPE
jgi:hypothetical protein